MKHFTPPFLCLLIALPDLLLPVAATSVEDLCRAAASGDPNINYDFCATSLRRYSRSNSADKKTFATIAASLASVSASSAVSKIKALLGSEDLRAEEALETCRSIYGDQTSTLADAIRAIGGGDLGSAKAMLRAAVDAPGDCESCFRELGVVSPLTKENEEGKQLAAIALAITNML